MKNCNIFWQNYNYIPFQLLFKNQRVVRLDFLYILFTQYVQKVLISRFTFMQSYFVVTDNTKYILVLFSVSSGRSSPSHWSSSSWSQSWSDWSPLRRRCEWEETTYIYLYKYQYVCLCVCVFVRVFLGYLESDWDTLWLWHKVAFCPRKGFNTKIYLIEDFIN